MRNPLAPSIEIFFMGTLDTNLFTPKMKMIQFTPSICRRHSLYIPKRRSIQKIPQKLNKLHKSINFTHELGGNELPFLDISIRLTREEIITKVHKNKSIQISF